jgi:hypothetical protein
MPSVIERKMLNNGEFNNLLNAPLTHAEGPITREFIPDNEYRFALTFSF